MNERILVVEDDESLRLTLVDNLESEGYSVTAARTLYAARRALELAGYDVVVLDLMLPDGSGYELAREMRRGGRGERILMLTARTLEDDVVRGFETGADDYVTKPYRLRELLARVGSLARRGPVVADVRRRLAFAGFVIDLEARTVTSPSGAAIALTRTELDLLTTFVTNAGIVRTRDQLIDAAWGADVMVDPRTVDNFVMALKRKLGWTTESKWKVVAVRGVGYRFEVS